MKNKRTKRSIVWLLNGLFFFSFLCSSAGARYNASEYYRVLAPTSEQCKTTLEVVGILQQRHYRPLDINDDMSSKLFDSYLSDLDPAKSYFLASDIKEFEAFRFHFDEDLKTGNLEAAFSVYNRFQQRVIQRLVFMLDQLQGGLPQYNFEKDETLSIDRKKSPWPATVEEIERLWIKRLKNGILNLKLADKKDSEIPGTLKKRYLNQLNQTAQVNSEDAFELYINSFTQMYDPHTQYFSPRTTENFNIHMSLSLEGIGAILQKEDEYTKVLRLVAGGPADKAKQLKPGDRIVGVGQGRQGEIIDVVGWRLDDVVEKIRGEKHTVVRLEIISADAEDVHKRTIIEILRDKVKLEEQSAKKKIIETTRNGKVFRFGVLDIPAFYLDFMAFQLGEKDYKSTTRDVFKLLTELSKEKLDGIIIDLRDNSGGSLQEAATVTGLFIENGPVVQIRYANKDVEVLRDPDPAVLYSGPLIVLVNRLSASASEIFAGAVQDYGRGIIMGQRTFGKGTVQTLISLGSGQLKTTMAKFYRISGESTQDRGITPDLFYPCLYDINEIGESSLDQALPWDTISQVSHDSNRRLKEIIPELQKSHEERIKKDPDYLYTLEMIKHLKTMRKKKELSLKESLRKEQTAETKKWRLDLENKRRMSKHQKLFKNISELEAETGDNSTQLNDPLLTESMFIFLDMFKLHGPAK